MSNSIIIINQFAGNAFSGWGERHFFLGENWVKKGFDVTIISSAENHMFTQQKIFNGKYLEEYCNGIRFIWLKIPRYNPKKYTRFLAMFVFVYRLLHLPSSLFKKQNILLLSSMPIFPALVIESLKKKWNITKLIFEVRDMWPETPIHLMGYSRNHPFIKFIAHLERKMLLISNDIVSVLPENRSYMERIAKKKLNWHYIPNGITPYPDTDSEIQIDQSIKEKIKNAKLVVTYTGTFGYANAMDILIESIPKINNKILFLLVGEGYLKREYQDRLHKQSNVIFLPRVEKCQVQSILKLSDICFISWHKSPLYNYGVSANKYFDYMYSSKPTLVISQGMNDPISLSGGGFIYNLKNPEELSQKLEEISELPTSEFKSKGAKAKEYVLKHHTFEVLAEKYMLVFNN